MTDPDHRHISIILDRSGSMERVKEDTEGGLRAFLREQHEVQARTTVSLYQFDDRYEVVYENKPLADVPDFTLHPRGTTALLDAIGRTITRLGDDLADLDEARRPGEVVVVILTDGLENASSDFSRSRIREMITHQQEKYRWVFVFLGADQDAFAAAGGMGIGPGNALNYTSRNTRESFRSASSMLRRARANGGDYSFTQQERDDASG